jgi:hypothetical protein
MKVTDDGTHSCLLRYNELMKAVMSLDRVQLLLLRTVWNRPRRPIHCDHYWFILLSNLSSNNSCLITRALWQ